MKNLYVATLFIMLAACLLFANASGASADPAAPASQDASTEATALADFKTVAASELPNLLAVSAMPSVVVRGSKDSPDRRRLAELVSLQSQIYAGLVQLVIVDQEPTPGQDSQPSCVEGYLPATTTPAKVVQFPCGGADIDALINSVLQAPGPSQSKPNNHCPL